MRRMAIAIALIVSLVAVCGCLGDPYKEYTAASDVAIDPSVSNYKDACSIARQHANGVESNLLLDMFDIEYVGMQSIVDRRGMCKYQFGKYRLGGNGEALEGYCIDVVLDLHRHLISEITVTYGNPIPVGAPPFDLNISDWTITEDEIIDYIYADIGKDTIERFRSPVLSWGGRLADGPVVIAQCYDDTDYERTLHSYFFDPRTGERIPDLWSTGL
jgi:hypothetical protein